MFDPSKLTLYLIRGVPGSGKSTLAKMIQLAYAANDDRIPAVVEMDDWRYDAQGNYTYDPARNREIADLCFSRCRFLLGEGRSLIVCNTFLKPASINPYRVLARKCGALFVELTCNSDFDSIHGISREEAQGMRKRFELA